MRLLLLFSIFFSGYTSVNAQPVRMTEGKVWVNDSACFRYEKLGEAIYNSPIDKGAPILNHNAHPEANGDAFQDIVFGTEHQFLVKARARMFASVQASYLIYFYNIQFASLNKEINLQYHPLLIQAFVKDMVKYKVIEDGFLNERGVNKLIAKWKKKPAYISEVQVKSGLVKNYNVSKISPKEKEENTINIIVKGNDIYHDDTLIGHYQLVKNLPMVGWSGSTKNNNMYKIEGLNNELMGWVKTPLLQPVFHLMPPGYKNSFAVVTTERNEQKVIAAAVKVLMLLSKEKEPISD